MKLLSILTAVLVLSLAPTMSFDTKTNTKSNIHYYNSSYGINGYDIVARKHGVFWPKSSNDIYQLGAGIVFGAKILDNTNTLKTVMTGYQTQNGTITYVPGSNVIDPTENVIENPKEIYPLYLSTEYDSKGISSNPSAPKWPLWKTENDYFGKYVADQKEREFSNYPNGPLYFAAETMVTVYKDTDLRYYGSYLGKTYSSLNLQVEEKTIFWDEEPLNDVVLVIYTITNMSQSDYKDASFAKLIDFDVKNKDDFKDMILAHSDESKRMVYCWSGLEDGPKGYMAISLIISPEVNSNGYPIEHNNYKNYAQGLDLATTHNYHIEEDTTDYITYERLTSKTSIGEANHYDQRVLLASETFNLAPGQSVSFGVAQIFGNAIKDGEQVHPSGDESELTDIEGKWVALYDKIYSEGLQSDGTAIEQENYHSNSAIFPNPTTGHVTFSESLGVVDKIEVFNSLGELVMSKINNDNTLNLTNLSNGIYMIRVQSANHSEIHKVILNK